MGPWCDGVDSKDGLPTRAFVLAQFACLWRVIVDIEGDAFSKNANEFNWVKSTFLPKLHDRRSAWPLPFFLWSHMMRVLCDAWL